MKRVAKQLRWCKKSTQGSRTSSTWEFWHFLSLLIFAKSSEYSTGYNLVPAEANRPFSFFERSATA